MQTHAQVNKNKEVRFPSSNTRSGCFTNCSETVLHENILHYICFNNMFLINWHPAVV